MTKYLLTFRNAIGHVPNDVEGPAWMTWFGDIGSSIADIGGVVTSAKSLGSAPTTDVVTGYTILEAADLQAAVLLAEGCPGLAHGGAVEVGELFTM